MLLGSLLPARPPESASTVAAGARLADATCAADMNIWAARSRTWPVERGSLLPALLPPVVAGARRLLPAAGEVRHPPSSG